jgi:hypothetical protein
MVELAHSKYKIAIHDFECATDAKELAWFLHRGGNMIFEPLK